MEVPYAAATTGQCACERCEVMEYGRLGEVEGGAVTSMRNRQDEACWDMASKVSLRAESTALSSEEPL